MTDRATSRVNILSEVPIEDFNHKGWFAIQSELEKQGFNYSSEVLSRGHNTIRAAINGYMKSNKGHREILLGSKYKYIGLGVTNKDKETHTCIILSRGITQDIKT